MENVNKRPDLLRNQSRIYMHEREVMVHAGSFTLPYSDHYQSYLAHQSPPDLNLTL